MLDMHCHLLPGIDDGSRNVQMSHDMLCQLYRQGVTTVVATPHFYATKNHPEKFLAERSAAIAVLGDLPENCPQIIAGAEVAYFDSMGQVEALDQLQVGNTGLLLVEMPFGPWSGRMMEQLQLLQQRGLQPVLAHADRYLAFDQLPRFLSWLQENDILLQCNCDAFLKLRRRRWAFEALRAGHIHFLGTDTHDLTGRAPNMDKALQAITKKLGAAPLKALDANAKKYGL